MVKQTYKFITGVFFLLVLIQCSDNIESCSETIPGPTYLLSDTIKSYLSNYEQDDQVIFTTSSGEEVALELSPRRDTLGNYIYNAPCEEDNDRAQTIQGQSQIITQSLSSSVLPESIFLYLAEYPPISDRLSYESLEIYLGPLSSDTKNGDGLLFLNTVEPQMIRFSDSLILNGQTFYDVIELDNPSPTPTLGIKFTQAQGIIYIQDLAADEEYFYLKTE